MNKHWLKYSDPLLWHLKFSSSASHFSWSSLGCFYTFIGVHLWLIQLDMTWKGAHTRLNKVSQLTIQHLKDSDCEKQDWWSDERKIELFGLNSKRHVWRKPGTAHHLPNTIPIVKRGGSIMLWGGFSVAGTGGLRVRGEGKHQLSTEYRVWILMSMWYFSFLSKIPADLALWFLQLSLKQDNKVQGSPTLFSSVSLT